MTSQATQKQYTFAEMIANRRQLFFFFVILAVACYIVPFTIASRAQVLKAIKEKPEGYRYPQVEDLYVCFAYAAVMWVLEIAVRDIGYRLINPVFPKMEDPDLRELKLQKAALSFFKLWFHGGLFAWGFYTLKDDPSFFKMVGGSGRFENSFIDYPYLQRTNPHLKTYMLTSAAYYLKVTIQHVFGPRRNDFVEILLHHFLAFYLLAWSFFLNDWEHGVIIVWLHYLNDALVALLRITIEIHPVTGMLVHCANIVVWIYNRLVAFPYVIYKVWNFEAFRPGGMRYVCLLLACLVMLHIHWIILLINILIKYGRDGSAEDTINKIETKKKVEKCQ